MQIKWQILKKRQIQKNNFSDRSYPARVPTFLQFPVTVIKEQIRVLVTRSVIRFHSPWYHASTVAVSVWTRDKENTTVVLRHHTVFFFFLLITVKMSQYVTERISEAPQKVEKSWSETRACLTRFSAWFFFESLLLITRDSRSKRSDLILDPVQITHVGRTWSRTPGSCLFCFFYKWE